MRRGSELPLIFVVLPRRGQASRWTRPERHGERYGLPGIPVDASDAVAIYRVAQEALGRAGRRWAGIDRVRSYAVEGVRETAAERSRRGCWRRCCSSAAWLRRRWMERERAQRSPSG